MTDSRPHLPRPRSPNDIDRQVGANLRRLRIERRMTLQELAAQLHVSHQQLQKYETASNRLSAGMLPLVADALGVDLTVLFETGNEADQDGDPADRLRKECEAWLKRTKSEETLRQMTRVLRALAS